MERNKKAMMVSKKEETIHWLKELIPLYEKARVAISEIANLNIESTSEDWYRAFTNGNAATLITVIEPITRLPQLKYRKNRKLKDCYHELISSCLRAEHLYLKYCYISKLNRIRYYQILYWTAHSKGLLEDFQDKLGKVQRVIKV